MEEFDELAMKDFLHKLIDEIAGVPDWHDKERWPEAQKIMDMHNMVDSTQFTRSTLIG